MAMKSITFGIEDEILPVQCEAIHAEDLSHDGVKVINPFL